MLLKKKDDGQKPIVYRLRVLMRLASYDRPWLGVECQKTVWCQNRLCINPLTLRSLAPIIWITFQIAQTYLYYILYYWPYPLIVCLLLFFYFKLNFFMVSFFSAYSATLSLCNVPWPRAGWISKIYVRWSVCCITSGWRARIASMHF